MIKNREGRKKRRRRPPKILLPMDLVTDDILTRLPVKSLMRFKCVSKLWSCHITSRYFTNRFLTVPSRPRPRLYMCLADRRNYQNNVILSLAPDTTSATSSSFVVDHDLTIQRRGYQIRQNLGGLICYTFPRNRPRIYNPATRQLITLPAPINIIYRVKEGGIHVSFFLGHDPVNNQFKVVCAIGVHLKRLQKVVVRSKHWVFVLKPGPGSWKKVINMASDFCPHVPAFKGLCIDGVTYYKAFIRTDNGMAWKCVIVSFNIRSEECKTIKMPLNGRFNNFSLIDYGGKLALVDHANFMDKGMLDLWLVEDAASKEWSKMSMVLQASQLHLVNNNIRFKVNGTTQNGKLFLIPDDLISPFHVLCYDLQSNELVKIEIKGIPDEWFSKDNARFDMMFMDHSESVMHIET